MKKTPTGADIDIDAEPNISGAITSLGHEPHQYVMFYMETPDADKTAELIRAHGGDVIIGPRDVPGGLGRFAWFKDPEGNMLGIYEKRR